MRRSVLVYGVLILFAAIVIFPLANMILLSFKSLGGIVGHPLSWPTHWHLANYGHAWQEGNLLAYLVNTAVVAIIAVTAITFLSSMAAYGIARFRFRGNQFIYLFFLAGLALPIQMIAVPLFILMRQLNLLDHLASVTIVYIASGLSFSVFLLVNFIRNVPRDLEEAALVDGAHPWQIYWHVVLPLVRPSLSVVAILNFIAAWNNFFFPLILLTNPSRMTVAVGVMSFVGQYATQWNLLLPALVIVTLPTMAAFIIVSRQFIRNMMAGAIKL